MTQTQPDPCPRKSCTGDVIPWGERSFFCRKCSLNFGRDEQGLLWEYDQGKRIYVTNPQVVRGKQQNTRSTPNPYHPTTNTPDLKRLTP